MIQPQTQKLLATLKEVCEPSTFEPTGGLPEPEVRVEIENGAVAIYIDSYGTKEAAPGSGNVVLIEQYEGAPRVAIWSDINHEDPTHIIPLAGAREGLREADAGGD